MKAQKQGREPGGFSFKALAHQKPLALPLAEHEGFRRGELGCLLSSGFDNPKSTPRFLMSGAWPDLSFEADFTLGNAAAVRRMPHRLLDGRARPTHIVFIGIWILAGSHRRPLHVIFFRRLSRFLFALMLRQHVVSITPLLHQLGLLQVLFLVRLALHGVPAQMLGKLGERTPGLVQARNTLS
jgi:hypothetical protein